MKTFARSFLLLAVLAAPSVQAQHVHHAVPSGSAPVPAQRWATDAPLRAGMAKIRTAVELLKHYEMGHLGQDQALVQAGEIQSQIAYLIANCKLDPAADAALHGILAKLAAGAQALKENPSNMVALAPMREALSLYAASFADPGWDQAVEPEEG